MQFSKQVNKMTTEYITSQTIERVLTPNPFIDRLLKTSPQPKPSWWDSLRSKAQRYIWDMRVKAASLIMGYDVEEKESW